MQDTSYTKTLIETKLYRPGLPVDMVRRPRLTAWLKREQKGRPLTLVSAPAGYGKSTLISCWLDDVDCPTAWLSLDEQDNDFERFLRYFLASIQTIFPDTLLETEILLTGIPQPSVTFVAETLINEINQIGTFFILVLDDYHVIDDQNIHDLMNELLLYPPKNLHLVIGTRMDPPLSLVTLRGKGRMTEVRIPSLRFTQEESLCLFRKMTGTSIDERNIAEIDTKAEGWVTGLRMAALAMRHRIGKDIFELKLSLNNRYVSDYLLNEILAKQAVMLSDCILKSSIPSRFCAGLCEALCFPDAASLEADPAESEFNGDQFLEWLRVSNLFIIPLDDQHEWYRYHHLFREFLQQELVRRLGHDEIRKLHKLAGRWYARNGYIDDAFYHLLPSGEISEAIALVARNRTKMLNETRWSLLENWLNLFQEETIESSAELWMLKTWLVYHHGRWLELPTLLGRLGAMVANEPDQEKVEKLAGEVHTLRSLIAYHMNDPEETISQARLALKLVPPDLWIVRILARLYLAGGLLMVGRQNESEQAIYLAFQEEKVQNKYFRSTLLNVACNIHWLSADLHSMEQAAKQSIELCLDAKSHQILGNSQSHLGCVYYQQNDLLAAEELFMVVVAMPYKNYGTAFTESVCGLSMTYLAQGRKVEARKVCDNAIAFLLETGNTSLMPDFLALQAELDLKCGNLSAASQWAAKFDQVPPLRPVFGFFIPHLTLVKVWLAQDTAQSLVKANEYLTKLQEYLANTYNTRFLIDTLILQALLAQALDDHESADTALMQALLLAQAGGFIRVFVDAGPEMARLLAQLKVDDGLRDYVDRIQSAFSGSHQTAGALDWGELLGALTGREMQILELLGERLSNKEIASQLVISPGTVKGHTIKIYQKLDVKSRRQAVEKATELGLLMPM